MSDYEKIGEGSYSVHRKKEEKGFDWNALFGAIFLGLVVLAVLGNL